MMIVNKLESYFESTNTLKNICTDKSYQITYDSAYSSSIQDKADKLSDKASDDSDKINEEYNQKKISKNKYEKEIKLINDKLEKELSDKQFDCIYIKPNLSVLPYIESVYSVTSGAIPLVADENNTEINNYSIDFLSEEYVNNLSFKMKSGKWLSDVKSSNDYIDVVATSESGLNVGDIITLKSGNYDGSEESIKKLKEAKAKVVGIIDYSLYKNTYESYENDNNYIQFNQIFNLNSDNLISKYPSGKATGEFSKIYFNTSEYLTNNRDIVKLKDNITQAQLNDFLKTATGHKYRVENMKKVYENTYAKDLKNFMNDIVFLSMSGLISVFSLIGIAALSVSNELKTYSVYCICGMTRKQCIGINALYLSIMTISSAVIVILAKLSTAFYSYTKHIDDVTSFAKKNSISKTELIKSISMWDYFDVTKNDMLFIFLLLIISILASMIIPYKTLKRFQPITILKEK